MVRRILYAVMFLTGCLPVDYEPAPCAPFATRCVGEVAQLCAPSGGWRRTLDCRDVTPGVWRCCPDARGRHVCRSEERCLSRDP